MNTLTLPLKVLILSPHSFLFKSVLSTKLHLNFRFLESFQSVLCCLDCSRSLYVDQQFKHLTRLSPRAGVEGGGGEEFSSQHRFPYTLLVYNSALWISTFYIHPGWTRYPIKLYQTTWLYRWLPTGAVDSCFYRTVALTTTLDNYRV